jgi:5-methylcytosine-specific restriction endonuclease McrA
VVVEPLSPARYKVQFTASGELHDKLERLQALMRSEVPDGDLAAIIERAVTEKIERIEARRYARTSAPRQELKDTDTAPTSRHIPAAVRRAVRERDGDRCRYVDESGRRCSERGRLEFHHRHPFGMGGDHSPANLRLLCASHNRHLAEHDYGRNAIRRRRAEPASASQLHAPGPPCLAVWVSNRGEQSG